MITVFAKGEINRAVCVLRSYFCEKKQQHLLIDLSERTFIKTLPVVILVWWDYGFFFFGIYVLSDFLH